jgi:hypothetical protein
MNERPITASNLLAAVGCAHTALAHIARVMCIALACAALPARADEPAAAVRRYAIIASSNDGGPERARLRFADTDARAVAEVFGELGGLQRADLLLIPNATRTLLLAAFDRIRSELAKHSAALPRRELFIYYSGHSDETGILLGADRLSYDELRSLIEASAAEVRIVVLDSCAAGAVIRPRGGVHRPPFLSDASTAARGHAFLTASSADEAAQESDRIAGGYFTHYLVSGLRGAADSSRDGRVTLAEAYQFAYDETLRQTRAAPRAQHPAYDIQLAGTGDLVLTDLRSTSAALVLADELSGRVEVRDALSRLVVEFSKEPERPLRLGLPPGEYRIALALGEERREAVVILRRDGEARLDRSHFVDAQSEPAAKRGIAADGGEVKAPATLFDRMPKFGAYAGLGFRYARLMGQDNLLAGIEAALLLDHRIALGFAAYGWSADREGTVTGVTLGYGGLLLRYHLLFDSPFVVSFAVLAAPGGISVSRGDPEQVSERDSDGIFVCEPQVSAHLQIARILRLGADFGYRIVAGVDNFETGDFRGFLGGFHIQVGWF